MKIHAEITQGSVDWEIIRAGKVTASEMDALITPLGKIKVGEGVKSYAMKKVAERWLGGPLPSAYFWDGEQGQMLEEIAKPAFTVETGFDVRNVGFITSDDERSGCSPDGMILDGKCGLEIKCPHVETHIRYLLDRKLPVDYVAQVQGAMLVTGFDQWYFASFRRGFPMFILKVERDEPFIANLRQAVEEFNATVDAAMSELVRLNGGPPKQKFIPTPPQPKPEYVDLMP